MYAGYHLFSHVKNRIVAWLDPLSVIDKAGYQVCQSLFAIGTGGLFGFGLGQGLPNKIPIVSKDFIIAAISEEMGGIFAVCLIMVCVSCFLMIFNLSMQMKDAFYKYVALGLGSVYALQVLLTVGGSTKFIPMTGVTLPLVSYGGSSLLSTMIIFGMIQGMYIMQAAPEKRRNIDERQTNEFICKYIRRNCSVLSNAFICSFNCLYFVRQHFIFWNKLNQYFKYCFCVTVIY